MASNQNSENSKSLTEHAIFAAHEVVKSKQEWLNSMTVKLDIQEYLNYDGMPTPYPSALLMPSFTDMAKQLLDLSMRTDLKPDLKLLFHDLCQQFIETYEVLSVVDRFYDLLGNRNWICHEHLPATEIKQILEEASKAESPEDYAESRLMEFYQDKSWMRSWISHLCQLDPFAERKKKIRKAEKYYHDQDWETCILYLLPEMDGAVQEFDLKNKSSREGLHARNPNTMVAYQSFVGHEKGLSKVLERFLQSVRKRPKLTMQDYKRGIFNPYGLQEEYNVPRHAIVHGMVGDINNPTAATKAWNLLFSLGDWMRSIKQAKFDMENPQSLEEDIEVIIRHLKYLQNDNNFVPSTILPSEEKFISDPIFVKSNSFLEDLSKGRWQKIWDHYDDRHRELGGWKNIGDLIIDFQLHQVKSWEIEKIEYHAFDYAKVYATGTVWTMENGGKVMENKGTIRLVWTFSDNEGNLPEDLNLKGKQDFWHLALTSPFAFMPKNDNTETRILENEKWKLEWWKNREL